MKVTIESTSKLVEVNGVPARVWEGVTASGIPVQCFVTRVAIHPDHDQAQFEQELAQCRAPSAEAEAIPMRMIL
jgi:hypothetical protein